MAELTREELIAERTFQEEEKARFLQRQQDILNDPAPLLAERLAKVEAHLARVPNRRAKKQGNITMREKLLQVKDRIENQPSGYVQEELTRCAEFRIACDEKITEINEELTRRAR